MTMPHLRPGAVPPWRALPVQAPVAFLVRMLGLMLVAAACGNALLYSDAAATPLVQSDAWYFLESFLTRYFDGTLTFLDLFVQRGAGDHAQPLQKLVLLFHTRYYALDFGIEGLIGTAIGILWCCAVAHEMRRQPLPDPLRNALSWLCIGLVFALGLSLNSSNIYTWPLATLGYIPLVLGTLYFSLVMTQLERQRPLWILLATALLGACIDEIAVVVVIAAALACVPLLGSNHRQKAITVGCAVAGLVLARIFLAWVAYRAGASSALIVAKGSLVDTLLNPDALRGLLIPFSDSLIHIEHLARWFPANTPKAVLLCASAAALLHAYFWFCILQAWRNGRYTRTLAMATFLMLVAYALTAGIIISRVPAYDWNYLHQPRYVMSYQMSLVAVAVLFQQRLCQIDLDASRVRLWIERTVVVVMLAMLLSVQWYVSRANWGLPHYLTPYWQNAALSMQTLAADPLQEPGPCPDIMTVCGYPAERRAKLMGLLMEKQLNIFSPAFQMRYRLYPSLANIPGFGPGQPQDQHFDPRIRQAAVPAVLAAQPKPGSCATDGSAQPVQVSFDTHDLAPFGAQLWVESVGASRTLLATTAPGQPTLSIEHPIQNHSVLSLVRADGQGVLAQSQVELPACAPAAR